MPSQKDSLQLVQDIQSACCKARERGMTYDAIIADIRTVEAQVRIAQRQQRLDHERRAQMQPGSTERLRVGYQPMRKLIGNLMNQLPVQKTG